MKRLFQLRIEQWMLAGVLVAAGLLLGAKAYLDSAGQSDGNGGKAGKSPAKLLSEQYAGIGHDWKPPLTLTVRDHRVFVSRLIVYSPKSGNIEWLDPEKEMDDGIKPSWKLKYGFSIEDPDLKNQDADNDGFTNWEEYVADPQTDPTDPKSRPSILVKLRMVKYAYVPFRIQFKAANRLPDGSLQFQLNLLDVSKQKTRFVKTGDEIEGYKVGEYREKIVKEFDPRIGYEITRNKSELDLINIKLNETVVLVLNTEKESDESRVKFKINVPDARVAPDEVKRGDTFKVLYKQDGLPAEMEFQLLKGNGEGATIKDVKTGKTEEIGVEK